MLGILTRRARRGRGRQRSGVFILHVQSVINVNYKNYHLVHVQVTKSQDKCIFFRYGPSSKTFTLEAGRRAQSGEGYFIFKTKEADIIYQHVTDIKDAMKSKMKIDQGRGTEATMFIA